MSPLFPGGVAIAALVVTAIVDGRSGLAGLGRRLLAWRFGPGWYAAAIGLPIVVTAFAVVTNPLFGGTRPTWASAPPPGRLLLLLVILLVLPIAAPLGEEIGWRGFALPRLLSHYSPLTASLVLGVVWSAWHLPAVVADPSIRPPVPFLLSLIPTSVVVTWLCRGTGGSIAVAVLYHACTDLTLAVAASLTQVADAARLFWLLTVAQTLVAATVVLVDRIGWLTMPQSRRSATGA